MNKALFLDRDGVVNVEINYLHKIEDFEFINGIINLCKYYQNNGYIIIIVTNQSGIDRGYYDECDFNILTSWMINEFAKYNVNIKKVYFCPHHPDISGTCSCRKPESGMFLEAAKEFDIDFKNSILIGDKESDIEAAIKAGVSKTYLFDEKNIVKKSKATKIVSKLEDIYSVNTK
ncbi:MAG: D,D-heptose 1,7-bisphosphate phosphatase [Sulfurimonas sp. RIFOXYD12_FULL_33_39]|uniref:D-glycero-beta-D-manno-heptose 1,7-bisphosphate 7-phosphatase n=1 Tax=unclassified Sulfurimonas TaxID=2623549 RepID=UPI0008ADEC5D|nr:MULTISPECIES: D-glycero-beta-D-manno-heptose 1,7-bisphosphate 7-phosphatase [unclassified Sulfurimonas]OHE03712.1 MAG: D,D-heptose 1,7-bisphosphate phosphatase [Sulfurimonas sp. RIFCSPLOWO2_12_FULL_34_6]OHE09056.1 MAG: D,D-heptose 1,7-bisphosphate phosphatase [Sulfurimonas sp. RIFOXYD12_FULL_33_39]OHE14373.1 MAG: D,D-heptose 1,7-bisphosphate phosphatase [Sulfurimonas sp. RIFOXYD2_FULL_34_21]